MSFINLQQKVEINTICLFSENDQDPCSHIRILGPMDHLNIKVIKGFKDSVLNLDGISVCDLVVIQRIFPRHLDLYEQVIEKARAERKIVVFDMDDFLFALPDDHPERIDHVYTSAILPMIRAVLEADLVTVSTDKLKDSLSDLNKNVVVIPNYLDDKLWQLTRPPSSVAKDAPVVIGYMGSTSHEPDLKVITPVLQNLIQKYPDLVKFQFWGIKPPDDLDLSPQVSWSPSITYNYRDFSEYFQKQQADIWVAPLVDNFFNRCKSGIKHLEYTALGAPGVYSNLEPYNTIVSHEYDGFLAYTEPEWFQYLSLLIENVPLRIKLASNAQNTIKTQWLLSKNCSKWVDAIQLTIQDNPYDKEMGKTRNSLLIKEASKQIHELLLAKNEKIHHLDTEISNKDQKIDTLMDTINIRESEIRNRDLRIDTLVDTLNSRELEIRNKDQKINILENALNTSENEIIQYVESTSWKLTRPMRKISKLFRK